MNAPTPASFRRQFLIHHAARGLQRARSLASALTMAGAGRRVLSSLGVGLHVADLLVGALERPLEQMAAGWHPVRLPAGFSPTVATVLERSAVKASNNWTLCEVGGQGVLTHKGEAAFAERDAEAVREHLRREVARAIGSSGQVVPLGRWGDDVEVVAAPPPALTTSAREAEVWRRVERAILAGRCRAVLLDGPPGTGKNTIARSLARRALDLAGPGATVVRVAVSDFGYLRPTVLDGLLDLLRPEVVLLDDIDRFGGCDQLLDLLESMHGRQRLVVASANDVSKIPAAALRPGRFDEVVRVEGVGRDLALSILGSEAARVSEALLERMTKWPAAHVAEVAERLRTVPDADPGAEVEDVGKRVST